MTQALETLLLEALERISAMNPSTAMMAAPEMARNALTAWNTRKPCDAGLREALTDARAAIDTLDEDAFGLVIDQHTGMPSYPVRDELLAKIDAALSKGDATR